MTKEELAKEVAKDNIPWCDDIEPEFVVEACEEMFDTLMEKAKEWFKKENYSSSIIDDFLTYMNK